MQRASLDGAISVGLISWVQHFTLPPPLINSLRSTDIGQ